MLDHKLCLRAQAQALQATDAVRRRYAPKYSVNHPPIGGTNPVPRAWYDLLKGQEHYPEDGWKPTGK